MTSYLNNGYDIMKYFAKLEKFLPHKIIIPDCRKSNARVRPGGPYEIGNQNTPYKIGFIVESVARVSQHVLFTHHLLVKQV